MQQVLADAGPAPAQAPRRSLLYRTGALAVAAALQAQAFLGFVGELAWVAGRQVRGRTRWRWRAVLHEVQIAGFDALPIVGLMSFLLGVVVAYQGADQLRHYGANVFVVELVGYAMLREFAPLMVAIISADSVGRQTTLAVVQAIFVVIVADALFSVAFNLLGL